MFWLLLLSKFKLMGLIDTAQFSIKSTALHYILAVTSMTFYHITKPYFQYTLTNTNIFTLH